MLIGFVVLYLVLSIGIGLYAATKVHSAADYITAGRSLPMVIVITMVFATWFGAETVLGIPATFLDENLGGTISDPFGASLALILFGLFFAFRAGLCRDLVGLLTREELAIGPLENVAGRRELDLEIEAGMGLAHQ